MKRIIAIAALLAAGVVAACSQGGQASPSFSLPSVAPVGSSAPSMAAPAASQPGSVGGAGSSGAPMPSAS